MDWAQWAEREAKRAKLDRRVQCIRCESCHRLRQHPKKDDPRTWRCPCGGTSFLETFPHPDEVQIALKLYDREIQESNVLSAVVQEMAQEFDHG